MKFTTSTITPERILKFNDQSINKPPETSHSPILTIVVGFSVKMKNKQYNEDSADNESIILTINSILVSLILLLKKMQKIKLINGRKTERKNIL